MLCQVVLKLAGYVNFYYSKFGWGGGSLGIGHVEPFHYKFYAIVVLLWDFKVLRFETVWGGGMIVL